MPPAPSGAVDSAVKDIRDGLQRERAHKPSSMKEAQHKLHISDSSDHGKPMQSTSSPPLAKARKVKKKKKGQKASQSSHLDVDAKATLMKPAEKAEGSKHREKSPVRTPTPPSPEVDSSSHLKEVSKDKILGGDSLKSRSEGVANGPRTPPEVALKKSGESNIPTKRRDPAELDGGKQRTGYHRRDKREQNEHLKVSDSGSSGSTGFARNVSLAVVEEVLRDLPAGSLSRPSRKQDLGGHSDIPTPPVESPREKLTDAGLECEVDTILIHSGSGKQEFIYNSNLDPKFVHIVGDGVIKMDIAYGNVSSAISAVLPKLHKSNWTATSSASTKSTIISSGPIGNGLGEGVSGKDHARDSKPSANEDKDVVSFPVQSATSTASQSRAPNPRVQDKPPISPPLSSEHESPNCMLRTEGTSSLASQSSQAHLPEAAVESATSSGDGPTAVGAVSVVGCGPNNRKLNATILSGVKKLFRLNNGQLYSEGGIRAVHREQLIFDMNDFDEEEVYIRRNRSGGSLSGSHGCPGTPGPAESHGETTEGISMTAEGNGNGLSPDWRYGNGGHIPSSTPLGPLNFRFANGVFHRHIQEEDHCSEGSVSSCQQISSSGVAVQGQISSDVQVVSTPVLGEVIGQIGNVTGGENRSSNGGEASVIFTREPSTQKIDVSSAVRCDAGVPSSNNQLGIGDPLGSNEVSVDGRLQNSSKGHNSSSPDGRKSRQSDQDEQGMVYTSLPGPSNDLDRLLMQATPMLQLDPSARPKDAVENLTLDDVWSFYYEPSMFGREVYIQGGNRGPSCAYFLPYLSAIQIFVPDDDQGGYGSQSDRMYLCDIDYWPKFMRLHFEQFESNPPWYRLPLHDTMIQLAESFSELKTMRLKDLHPASWFCVAWYPLYRIPDAPLATRFLTYHTFHPPLSNINTVYQGGVVPLPVYGLEWYNMRDEPQWMDNISLAKSPRQTGIQIPNSSSNDAAPQGTDAESNWENQAWQMHVRELRTNAKKFARGIGLRKMTRRGIEEANTHHHDFEYFYERN